MSRARTEYCYACGMPAAELDHFPVSESNGGTKVLPICRGCHDTKDRFTLDNWSVEVAFTALSGLWSKSTRDERLMLMKIVHVLNMASVLLAGQEQPKTPRRRKGDADRARRRAKSRTPAESLQHEEP